MMDDATHEEPLSQAHENYKTLIHLAYAVLAAIAALCLIQALQPLFAGNHSYWLLWPVVILSARFWGPASAGLAALVGWLGVWYWFIPPNNSFAILNRSDLVGLVSFAVIAGLIIVSSLREREMHHRMAATARTVSKTMATLLGAYSDAVCRCPDRAHGHDLGCPAHPSGPLIVRAERSIRMLAVLGVQDSSSQRRDGAPQNI